jgi:hypothetical protein
MNEYVNKTINNAFCVKPLTEEEKKFIIDGYVGSNKEELIRVATKKKVLPVVGKLMSNLNLDKDYWEGQYNRFKERNIKITELIARIFTAFQENGITRICAFENYGALLSAETDIALYSSGDVDLYAEVDQKEAIIRVLDGFGYQPTKDEINERNIMSEFLKDNGIIRINVAWKPLRRFSLPFKAHTEKYFEWDKMGYYKDTAIRIPSPETLLYLCFLRIAVHGYSRSPDIRLYIDTYNASFNNPDWYQVVEWAKTDGVITKFVTVASIAHDLIKLDVPEDVLKISETNKFSQKILAITYDFTRHTLKYDPTGISLLKVEAASDDRSVMGEIIRMLFPPKEWVKEYNRNRDENMVNAYVRYYKRLL